MSSSRATSTSLSGSRRRSSCSSHSAPSTTPRTTTRGLVGGTHPRDARVGGQQLAAGDDAGREPGRPAAPCGRLRNWTGFTYTVLDPASRDVVGCVYIYPLPDSDYDARALSWVRASHALLDTPLWRVVSDGSRPTGRSAASSTRRAPSAPSSPAARVGRETFLNAGPSERDLAQ